MDESGTPVEQSLDDYITTENARERSAPVAVVEPEPAPAPPVEVVAEPVEPTDRNPDGTFKPKKPRNDPQARIDQVIGEREAARREAAALKAELDAARRPVAAVTPPPAPKPIDEAMPKVGDFDDYEAFVDARSLYVARKEIRDQQRQQYETHLAQEREVVEREREAGFLKRYHAVLAAEPDFPTKLDQRLLETKRLSALSPDERKNATFGNFLMDQVWDVEHLRGVLLHLSNEEEIQRLATLHRKYGDNAVIRELAKLDARLDAAPTPGPAPTPVPVSRAKPPIQPVGSSPPAADPNDIPDDLSPDEHIRRYNALDARARVRRA